MGFTHYNHPVSDINAFIIISLYDVSAPLGKVSDESNEIKK